MTTDTTSTEVLNANSSFIPLVYINVFVNFEVLTQASDIRIERRHIVFLCLIQDSNPGTQNQITSKLNAPWQTDWAIEDPAKKLNSTARPYDQRPFSPLDPTASWLCHLALAIYMCIVVNFDALAQGCDIRIEMIQIAFLCWMHNSNPGSQTPNRQQTECLLTNRLSFRGTSSCAVFTLHIERNKLHIWG